jgi:hypothetical protein
VGNNPIIGRDLNGESSYLNFSSYTVDRVDDDGNADIFLWDPDGSFKPQLLAKWEGDEKNLPFGSRVDLSFDWDSYSKKAVESGVAAVRQQSLWKGTIEESMPSGMEKFGFSGKGGMDFYPGLALQGDYYKVGGYIYEAHKAGNYLWGAGMASLGWSYGDVKLGSEFNAFLMAKAQNGGGGGLSWEGDNVHDQRAISRGYFEVMAKQINGGLR